MQKAWKLVVLGAIAALGAFALLWGATGGPPTARAAVGTASVSPNPVTNPNAATITLGAVETDATTGGGPITVSVGGGTIAFGSCTTTVSCTAINHSGDGSASMTVSTATDGDATAGEALTLTFTWTPPTVLVATNVSISACQGTSCTPVQVALASVLPAAVATNTPIATAVPTVGPAAAVTVTGPSQTVSCAGSAFVQVTVKDAAGNPVVDGTTVALSATIGSIPSSGTTSGGGLFAVFTAPSTGAGGTATVSAVAGGVTGSTTVNVGACTAAPAPTSPPPPPPPVQQPVTQPRAVTPPSTGDAGLASSGGTAWQTYLGIALIVVSTLGAFAVVRQRQ